MPKPKQEENPHNHVPHEHEKELSPQELLMMNSAEEYKKGLQFYSKGKFRIS